MAAIHGLCALLVIRTLRVNAQGVNVGLHQRAERSIDHPMSLQCLRAGESPGNDSNTKVTTAISRAGVSGVFVTVVDDLERFRRKGVLEALTNQRNALGSHGRTCRMGFISTSPNTPSST